MGKWDDAPDPGTNSPVGVVSGGGAPNKEPEVKDDDEEFRWDECGLCGKEWAGGGAPVVDAIADEVKVGIEDNVDGTGDGPGEENGDCDAEWDEEITIDAGLADKEWQETAIGEGVGASRLMTAGLTQPLLLLASEPWLGPGVMVTGVLGPWISSSSELSRVKSITSCCFEPAKCKHIVKYSKMYSTF